MPNPWSDRNRDEDRALEQRDTVLRNPDSSVSAQYEDHAPPDQTPDHDDRS